jgi:hypothetical protein
VDGAERLIFKGSFRYELHDQLVLILIAIDMGRATQQHVTGVSERLQPSVSLVSGVSYWLTYGRLHRKYA